MIKPKEKSEYSVLIIDDEKELIESLELALSRICNLKLILSTAIDGEEGLNICENFEFDAVVTDYFMPKLDGIEFIKKFRSLPHNKSTPVIFTSGYFSELDFEKNKSFFENVIFLEKPYSFDTLSSFLRIHLESEKIG